MDLDFDSTDLLFQVVTADGEECKAEPVSELPLTHQYFIY